MSELSFIASLQEVFKDHPLLLGMIVMGVLLSKPVFQYLTRSKEISADANKAMLLKLEARVNLLETEVAEWKDKYYSIRTELSQLEAEHLKLRALYGSNDYPKFQKT